MACTPSRCSAATWRRTPSSSSGTSTAPRASSRSRTPRRRRRGATKVGVSGSMSMSYMRERFCRPSSSTSSKPSVASIAVTAPFCSSTALVATVVPWMKRSTAEAGALVEGHDVGEGAADVDADLHAGGPPGPLADSSAARGVARVEFVLVLRGARVYDEAPVQLGQRRRTGVLHHQLELPSEEIEHLVHTALTECRQSPRIWPADADGLRPKGEGLEDVRSATKPPVDEDRELAVNRIDNFGQALDRRAAALLRPPAVIRHDDPVHTM